MHCKYNVGKLAINIHIFHLFYLPQDIISIRSNCDGSLCIKYVDRGIGSQHSKCAPTLGQSKANVKFSASHTVHDSHSSPSIVTSHSQC